MSHFHQENFSGRHLLDRRKLMGEMAMGLSGIALAQLLGEENLLGQPPARRGVSEKTPILPQIDSARPHAAREPHFPARVRQVVMVFCSGAISQLDTFAKNWCLYEYVETVLMQRLN